MANNTEKIEIKIEGKEWESLLDKSYQKNMKSKSCDGFRKGHIPKDVYLRKFGVESLFADAVDMTTDSAYKKALEKTTIEPQIQPTLNIVSVDDKALTLEFVFVGKPDIELGEYKNLKIKKEKIQISEEEVSHEIEHLREEFAEIRVKEDGVVEDGDTAVIDFKGTVDNKPLENGDGENYPLEIGTNTFIPGFEDGVKGMKVGEEKDLHLKFPENYTADLAGKEVIFHVTLNEIKSRVLPEINSDFFADLGYDKVTNEEELKTEVEKVLKEQKENEAKDAFLDKVLETASNNMKVEIPKEIIDDEVHRMIHQFEHQLKSQGLNLEQYFKFTGLNHEAMHKEMEPEATKRVKYRYLIEEVAKVEKIEVTEEEANQDAEEMAKNYGITKEELLEAYGSMEVLKLDAQMRKTLKFLQENN